MGKVTIVKKSYIVTKGVSGDRCNPCNSCNFFNFLTCGGSRACPEIFFGILGTAHARQYRIPSGRETRFQAAKELQQEGANQKPRSIPADVPGIDAAAGKILGSRSERTGLARQVEKGPRMEGAVRGVVRRGKTQHLGKLSRSTLDWAAPEQGGDYLGR